MFCGIQDDYPYVGKHYKSDNDVTLLSLSCLWRNWENKISPVIEVNKFPYSLRHLQSMSFSNFGLTGKKQRPNLVGDFWAGSWINSYLERQSPVSKRAFWWRSLLQTIFNFWQKWNAKDRMSLHLAWGFHFRKVTGWCWDSFLRPALSDMKKFFMLLSVIITIPDIAVLKGKFFCFFFPKE